MLATHQKQQADWDWDRVSMGRPVVRRLERNKVFRPE